MQKDQWGYAVTTEEPQAVEALDRAFNGYFYFRTDAMTHLDTAIAADPQFALPHAAKGILIVTLAKPELYPLARSEFELAKNSDLIVVGGETKEEDAPTNLIL